MVLRDNEGNILINHINGLSKSGTGFHNAQVFLEGEKIKIIRISDNQLMDISNLPTNQ